MANGGRTAQMCRGSHVFPLSSRKTTDMGYTRKGSPRGGRGLHWLPPATRTENVEKMLRKCEKGFHVKQVRQYKGKHMKPLGKMSAVAKSKKLFTEALFDTVRIEVMHLESYDKSMGVLLSHAVPFSDGFKGV